MLDRRSKLWTLEKHCLNVKSEEAGGFVKMLRPTLNTSLHQINYNFPLSHSVALNQFLLSIDNLFLVLL